MKCAGWTSANAPDITEAEGGWFGERPARPVLCAQRFRGSRTPKLSNAPASDHNQTVKWNAAYRPEDSDATEHAAVEATDATQAVSRLREIVGTETDVLYVLPDTSSAGDSTDSYEAFLHDPDANDAQ